MALPSSMLVDRLPQGRRKLYGRPDGVEDVFRPMRRVLRPRESSETETGGKRFIAPLKCLSELKHPERLHNRGAQNRSGYDVPEQLAWSCKGPVYHDGELAQERVSTERTLEIECGIKKKCDSLLARRSGIAVRASGDKSYAVVACSPGYYKMEGLIPGACIDDRRRKEEIRAHKPAARHLTYEQKCRAEKLRNELLDVGELTNARDDLEGQASWEERTGMYVWRTKAMRAKATAAAEADEPALGSPRRSDAGSNQSSPRKAPG